jgi:hypothetical protein
MDCDQLNEDYNAFNNGNNTEAEFYYLLYIIATIPPRKTTITESDKQNLFQKVNEMPMITRTNFSTSKTDTGEKYNKFKNNYRGFIANNERIKKSKNPDKNELYKKLYKNPTDLITDTIPKDDKDAKHEFEDKFRETFNAQDDTSQIDTQQKILNSTIFSLDVPTQNILGALCGMDENNIKANMKIDKRQTYTAKEKNQKYQIILEFFRTMIYNFLSFLDSNLTELWFQEFLVIVANNKEHISKNYPRCTMQIRINMTLYMIREELQKEMKNNLTEENILSFMDFLKKTTCVNLLSDTKPELSFLKPHENNDLKKIPKLQRDNTSARKSVNPLPSIPEESKSKNPLPMKSDIILPRIPGESKNNPFSNNSNNPFRRRFVPPSKNPVSEQIPYSHDGIGGTKQKKKQTKKTKKTNKTNKNKKQKKQTKKTNKKKII